MAIVTKTESQEVLIINLVYQWFNIHAEEWGDGGGIRISYAEMCTSVMS